MLTTQTRLLGRSRTSPPPSSNAPHLDFAIVKSLGLESLQFGIVPAEEQCQHVCVCSGTCFMTHLRNWPESSWGAPMTSSAMTCPGLSGGSNFPSRLAPTNFCWSCRSMFLRYFSRISPCIAVSTTPGLMEMLVTSGSSLVRVIARWLTAALVAPYAPQELYAPVAAPDDVITILPLAGRRSGNAARV